MSIDIVSATRGLVAQGSSFGTSNEITAAVAGGVVTELADELMAVLGSPFDTLSGEDVTAILDLYAHTPSVAKTAYAKDVPEAPSLFNGLKLCPTLLNRQLEMKLPVLPVPV